MINPLGGILVDQAFKNVNLPVSVTVASSLISDEKVKNWFQADANYVSLSGDDIVSFNDRKGTGDKLNRASDNTGPTLVNGLFGSYSGARFNSSESDRTLFSGNAQNLSSPFSWSGVATLRNLAASSTMCGTFSSSSVRAILAVSVSGTNAGKLLFQYGTATVVGPTIELNKPFAFACGFDGASIFIRMGGITYTAAAAGAPSTSSFALGALPGGSQFWDGDIGEIFLCNDSLNSSTGEILLNKLINFYKTVYSLDL